MRKQVTTTKNLRNAPNLKPLSYQRLFDYLSWLSLLVIGLGAIVESVRSIILAISPDVSILITIGVVLTWLGLHLYLRRHPVRWVTEGREEHLTSLPLRGQGVFLILVVLFLSGPLTHYLRSEPTQIATAREMALNVEMLGRKIKMLKEGFGFEPRDETEKALRRVVRARNLEFARHYYESARNEMVRLSFYMEVDKFYQRLKLAEKYESVILAVMEKERRLEQSLVARAYPWHHIESLRKYHMLLLLYGRKILVQELDYTEPFVLASSLEGEIAEEESALQALSGRLNTTTLETLDMNLTFIDEVIIRADSAKDFLPNYKQ